jgi:hypothetical protein
MSLTTEAIDRLAGQFQQSPKIKGMLEAVVGPLDAVLVDIDALKNERWIDTAIGVQLDNCGEIVGEKRLGRDDDAYRAAIRFRVFVNISNGTPSDMQQALAFLVGGDDRQYLEVYPATVMLFTNGAPGTYIEKFERPGPATYIDGGVLKYAAVDEPRYQDGVLLVEGEATNLLTWSEDFTQNFWNKNETTVTANAALAPDGTLTAGKLVESSFFAPHGLYASSINTADGDVLWVSSFVKSAGRNYFALISYRGDGDRSTFVDLSQGVILLSDAEDAKITALAGGWYLVQHKITLTSGGFFAYRHQIYLQDGPNKPNQQQYQGDGTSGIYIWGAQLETGPVATSYIPTTTSPVTRAADRIYYEQNSDGFTGIQSQIQDIAPAAISDVPVMVSYTQKPFRFGREALPGELFVNDQYLTANGSDLQVNTGQVTSIGPTLGGIVPSELTANGSLIELSDGSILVINSPNHDIVLDSGYHLTGVFQ